MTELESVMYLLVEEIRKLRADLKLSTNRKLLLSERQEIDDEHSKLMSKLKKRKKEGDC
jgi:hypothetical protein